MPASLEGKVQTDDSDDRKFITLKVVGVDGKPVYRNVSKRKTPRWLGTGRPSFKALLNPKPL